MFIICYLLVVLTYRTNEYPEFRMHNSVSKEFVLYFLILFTSTFLFDLVNTMSFIL